MLLNSLRHRGVDIDNFLMMLVLAVYLWGDLASS